MVTVVHPRLPPRRAAASARTWWGRAWVRAVEEAAYSADDLRRARSLARSGSLGAVTVEEGGFAAVVDDGAGTWTAVGSVPVLDAAAAATLVETVAAQPGHLVALLAGDLPHALVEHAEEAGVELLPYGGELGTSCTCDAWADPCPHALAALHQLARLLDEDPFVLLHLRGVPRDDLLARLHARAAPDGAPSSDVDTAADAAVRAARVLELLGRPGTRIEHLL